MTKPVVPGSQAETARPSERERAREQVVLINSDYNAVMRRLQDYNPTAQGLPSEDEARVGEPIRPLTQRAGAAERRQQLSAVRAMQDVHRRLERMADAPRLHGLRQTLCA